MIDLNINAVQKVLRKLKGIDFSSSEKYKKEFFKYLTELGRFKNEDNAINWYKNVYMVKMILVLTKKYHKRPDVEKVINILKSKILRHYKGYKVLELLVDDAALVIEVEHVTKIEVADRKVDESLGGRRKLGL